jgi:signal transduction histidine kinase
MKLTSILILVFLSVNLFPQGKNDSLLNLVETAPDTTKIRLLKELCWENRYTNPVDALKYGQQALALAKELEMFGEESSINNYLGIVQRNVGDHATALEYFFSAQRLAEDHNNDQQLAYAFNNIGDIYNMEENFQQALEYELKALKLFEEIKDSVGVSYTCHQIARAYTNLEEYPSAIKYDTRAMKIRESLGNWIGVGYSLVSIGETYQKMGKHAEALSHLFKSAEIFKERKDQFGLAVSYYSLGLYYRENGDLQNAEKYLTESLNLGKETRSPIRIRNAAEVLSEIYAEQNRFKEAYQMHILYKETYDSLYREENLVKITQLVMQHEFEQRELMQLAEIARQKQFRNYLMVLFGLVVVLVIVILNRYQIKRKANIDLQNKNREIESQKKKLENLFVSLRIKNDELYQQNEEIITQKDHLAMLNHELEKQKYELSKTLNELRQAQTNLVQSEKMASLGQLTAGVAHELNNPINFISSGIRPLQRNVEDLLSLLEKYDSVIEKNNLTAGFGEVEELKESVDLDYLIKETHNLLKGILEGSSRSMQIVRDLRTFSRMDENEFKLVDIHDGIDSTLLLLHHKMQNRITVHKNYGKIPHVECLPGKLNQVFMNILTNSIQAIDGKGEIIIETSGSEDKVRISFKDSGKGMPPEVREHIFEPFFTTRAVGEGTGLGLSISYSIIEEHGGTIEVASEPGKGTAFVITLPLSRPEK